MLVNLAAATRRNRKPHAPHPLARKIERAPGALRLAGIATTAMDAANPRFSSSDTCSVTLCNARASTAPRRG